MAKLAKVSVETMVWETPPEPTTEYDKIVDALKAKPNQWARLREAPGQGGCYSSSKSLKGHPRAAGIETVVVKVDDVFRLYARYVPKGRNGHDAPGPQTPE